MMLYQAKSLFNVSPNCRLRLDEKGQNGRITKGDLPPD